MEKIVFSTHTCSKAEHDLLDLTGDDRKHDLLDPNGKGNKHDLIDLSGNDSISELSCNIAEYDLIDHSGNDSISTISSTIADNDLINLSVKDSISTPTCDLIESTGEFQQINELEHACLAARLDNTGRKVDFSKQNIKDLQRLDDNLLPMINYLEKRYFAKTSKGSPSFVGKSPRILYYGPTFISFQTCQIKAYSTNGRISTCHTQNIDSENFRTVS